MPKPTDVGVPGWLVIIVDEDLAVRNSLKFSLEIEGLRVHGFANAAELLSAGDLAHCSCLVVDQKIPGMTGLDLIAELRRRRLSMPAILITSHPGPALRERAERADIPIVEKPLLGNTLLDRIHEAIDDRRV
jgi:FixJ family two-component response regulator